MNSPFDPDCLQPYNESDLQLAQKAIVALREAEHLLGRSHGDFHQEYVDASKLLRRLQDSAAKLATHIVKAKTKLQTPVKLKTIEIDGVKYELKKVD